MTDPTPEERERVAERQAKPLTRPLSHGYTCLARSGGVCACGAVRVGVKP